MLQFLADAQTVVKLSRHERNEIDAGPTLQRANPEPSPGQALHWDGLEKIWSMILLLLEEPSTTFAKTFSPDITEMILAANTPEKIGEAYLTMISALRDHSQSTIASTIVPAGTGVIFDSSVMIHGGAPAKPGKDRYTLYSEVLTAKKPTQRKTADVVMSTQSMAVDEFQRYVPLGTQPMGESMELFAKVLVRTQLS